MKIDQGWQYAVYEFGGKVRKIPNSRESIKQILLNRDFKYKKGELERYIDRIIKDRDESIVGVQEKKIDRSLLGNPIFLNNGEYLQDRATTLRDKINEFGDDIKKGRQIIDEYISFIIKCWKNGFSERTYNLTKNNAYNCKGIILIDFGEITFSKEHIADRISKQRWLKSWSYNNDLDSNLRDYYSKQMKKHLTIQKLDKYWQSSKTLKQNI